LRLHKKRQHAHKAAIDLRFAIDAPAGATEGQKRAAVALAIFEGELPSGYSWKGPHPIGIRNPDTKKGKYRNWQFESLNKAGPTLRRVFRGIYESVVGRGLTMAEEREVGAAQPKPAKIPRKLRQQAAKKGHRTQAEHERKLGKRQVRAKRKRAGVKGWATRAFRKRSKAAKRGWVTRRKRAGKIAKTGVKRNIFSSGRRGL
jgi:hypothetical protein